MFLSFIGCLLILVSVYILYYLWQILHYNLNRGSKDNCDDIPYSTECELLKKTQYRKGYIYVNEDSLIFTDITDVTTLILFDTIVCCTILPYDVRNSLGMSKSISYESVPYSEFVYRDKLIVTTTKKEYEFRMRYGVDLKDAIDIKLNNSYFNMSNY